MRYDEPRLVWTRLTTQYLCVSYRVCYLLRRNFSRGTKRGVYRVRTGVQCSFLHCAARLHPHGRTTNPTAVGFHRPLERQGTPRRAAPLAGFAGEVSPLGVSWPWAAN